MDALGEGYDNSSQSQTTTTHHNGNHSTILWTFPSRSPYYLPISLFLGPMGKTIAGAREQLLSQRRHVVIGKTLHVKMWNTHLHQFAFFSDFIHTGSCYAILGAASWIVGAGR
ncbi:uncharacterized protein LY89DRAFT_691942 [Mollisia scopiformis]|uniref:Uncharacterized protein n=1 Tax=Mollisia scopiformis TaxID=149040 RepID=A0A132B3Z8_MOLSC|nr:uncharacterized protein LY89DRAFT_691942 [Mollisia scopiformis]KUJ07138.1 hypothetical protein LY89DRAFT_691942 [Mollisia scopiformis]